MHAATTINGDKVQKPIRYLESTGVKCDVVIKILKKEKISKYSPHSSIWILANITDQLISIDINSITGSCFHIDHNEGQVWICTPRASNILMNEGKITLTVPDIRFQD